MTNHPRAIYLDYNATTPIAAEVVESMLPYLHQHFGNPSSSSHPWGWAANQAIQKARAQVASLINAVPQEITFTSGATEANNWVIQAVVEEHLLIKKQPVHIISTNIEHPSIEKALKKVESWGAEVTRVSANQHGLIDAESVKAALRPHTKLISVIWTQNEIGTQQNISAIYKIARESQVLLHSDATQACGKTLIDLQQTPVDLLSASAHKFYGPKGVGFLYHRRSNPKVLIPPMIVGGGQEQNWRSGTENVAGIIGLGKAAELASSEILKNENSAREIQTYLLEQLNKKQINFQVHGDLHFRSAYNLNLCLPLLDPTLLQVWLPSLGLSQGSACNSDQVYSSPILKAIGVNEEDAKKSIRLSWGRGTTKEHIDQALEIINKCLK